MDLNNISKPQQAALLVYDVIWSPLHLNYHLSVHCKHVKEFPIHVFNMHCFRMKFFNADWKQFSMWDILRRGGIHRNLSNFVLKLNYQVVENNTYISEMLAFMGNIKIQMVETNSIYKSCTHYFFTSFCNVGKAMFIGIPSYPQGIKNQLHNRSQVSRGPNRV